MYFMSYLSYRRWDFRERVTRDGHALFRNQGPKPFRMKGHSSFHRKSNCDVLNNVPPPSNAERHDIRAQLDL